MAATAPNAEIDLRIPQPFRAFSIGWFTLLALAAVVSAIEAGVRGALPVLLISVVAAGLFAALAWRWSAVGIRTTGDSLIVVLLDAKDPEPVGDRLPPRWGTIPPPETRHQRSAHGRIIRGARGDRTILRFARSSRRAAGHAPPLARRLEAKRRPPHRRRRAAGILGSPA
jgi:hypothetical protein